VTAGWLRTQYNVVVCKPWYHRRHPLKSHGSFRVTITTVAAAAADVTPTACTSNLTPCPSNTTLTVIQYHHQQGNSAKSRVHFANTVNSDSESTGSGDCDQNSNSCRPTPTASVDRWKHGQLESQTAACKMWQVSSHSHDKNNSATTSWTHHLVLEPDSSPLEPPPVSLVAAFHPNVVRRPFTFLLSWWKHQVQTTLLPRGYPQSVATTAYAPYSVYSMLAAVAGSASMVLSTQTMLLALMVGSGSGGGAEIVDSGLLVDSSSSSSSSSEATGCHNHEGKESNGGPPAVSTTTTTAQAPSAVPTTSTVAVVASTAGGALNWVLKDGLGQLGGVLVASRLLSSSNSSSGSGSTTQQSTNTLDAHPKAWRMVAAVTLDVAAGLELLTPWFVATWASAHVGSSSSSYATVALVAWAATANVIKNVGFVAVSASRAALHQSLAVSSNLADVTAKSASQSMVAGLLGTCLGIATSSAIMANTSNMSLPPTTLFLACYGVLSLIHQGCVYQAVRAIAWNHFNRERLSLVLHHYLAMTPTMTTVTVENGSETTLKGRFLTPSQVASMESIVPESWSRPWTRSSTSSIGSWLSIGSCVESAFPLGPQQLSQCWQACPGAHHVINCVPKAASTATGLGKDNHVDFVVHLVFLESATTGRDLIMGVLHSHLLRTMLQSRSHEMHIGHQHSRPLEHNDVVFLTMIRESYHQALQCEPLLLPQLQSVGWDVSAARVEDSSSVRLLLTRDPSATTMRT
jgi:Vitamin B6 photo-protection and homoeostasis